MRRLVAFVLLAFLVFLGSAGPAAAAPEGTMTWAVHITLAARWLDPAETEGIITPFMVLYAVHDALLKPMPAGPNTPSLAESWTMSRDGLVYEFVLRKGVRFQNGDPVTAADVKFSFERYRGAGAPALKQRVREIEIVDPGRVRFHLKEPWPDFMTFYGTSATGAAWIVPKACVEKVGDDGFKKAPIGAGPYKVVSFTPGVELVMEAWEGYWRKVPVMKRLVYRSMPEETTRAAALTSGVLPEIEDLFQRQARETDPKKREALLHQIQQVLHDRVMHVPIYELAFIWGVGPKVEEPGINLIKSFAYSGPLEDVRLKRP